MRYLILLMFCLLYSVVFSQSFNEKGCGIKINFVVSSHDNDSLSQSIYHFGFSDLGGTEPFSSTDTFKVVYPDTRYVSLEWSYRNDFYDMLFPPFDTLQWYKNDTLLERQEYHFEFSERNGGCRSIYSSSSSIKEVDQGFYQLRYYGEDTNLIKTRYPVIHVQLKDEKEEIPIETILYPNPAKNLVNLKLSKTINSGVIQIYNLQGQLVLSYSINNIEKTEQFDISQLNQGLYVFSVIDKRMGEEILRKKMVVH